MEFAAGVAVTRDITLVRPLRSGAMGRVWVARHAGLGSEVAVKFMAVKLARDKAMLARFTHEAEAASQINSPHVVRILEHGTTLDGALPFIAMELLHGESLEERLEREPKPSYDTLTTILRQVGSALDAAHARGIVHRDIKPDNIFITGRSPNLLVKVLDFGMAKSVRRRDQSIVTATGVAVGTPEYMSPEQVLGAKDVDFRSDLWALGAVAYRMLTGEIPFTASTPHALFFTICKGTFTPLSAHGAPIEFEPWFRRAFQPNKEKRFGSAREMVLRFDAAVSTARLAEDDDESTQMLPPADKLRGLERLRALGPDSQTNPRYGADDSVDQLARTLDRARRDADEAIDDEDSDEDSIPTQLVNPTAAIREALAELGDPMGAPESKTALRGVPEAPASAPHSPRTATIEVDDGAVSAFDRTINSKRNPFELLDEPGSTPPGDETSEDEPPPPDESVPGLARPRPPFGSDAPIDAYPDVTDADASGPRPALASHSPDSSGARISVSARQAAALTDDAPAHPREEIARESLPANATPIASVGRRPSAALKVGALAAVVAVAAIIVTTRSPRDDAASVEAAAAHADAERPPPSPAEPRPGHGSQASAPVAEPSARPEPSGAAEAPVASGHLSILCSPQCISVRLGETLLGPSPLLRREVPAGSHRLTLVRQGMPPSAVDIEIPAGDHVSRSFSLTSDATAAPGLGPSVRPSAPPPSDDPYADEALPVAPGETPPPPLYR